MNGRKDVKMRIHKHFSPNLNIAILQGYYVDNCNNECDFFHYLKLFIFEGI